MRENRSKKESLADNVIKCAKDKELTNKRTKQLAIMFLALKYACAAINAKHTIPFDSETQYFDYFIEKAEKELYGEKK